MTTPHLKKSIGRSPSRLALLLIALVFACLGLRQNAQAGYTVTLQEVGPDVIATGSGAIDLTGLTPDHLGFFVPTTLGSRISSHALISVVTGPTSGPVDVYLNPVSQVVLGIVGGVTTFANSGSGDLVGVFVVTDDVVFHRRALAVPRGYVSGAFLSDSATYRGETLATLGVTPGTSVWTWGTGANQNFTLQIPAPVAPPPPATDFNNDGKADFVLYNASTRQTAVWYMNNRGHVGGSAGPILPSDWSLVSVADFNRDGNPDYLLYNATTRQTVIWYLSGATHFAANHGPTLPSSWELVATADFNGDGYPDLVLYNPSSHQTVVWYMRNNVHFTGNHGPTLPPGWSLAAIADFNRDGDLDYLLLNPSTGQTVIWYMNGTTYISGRHGPTIMAGYDLVGAADLDRNGRADYVLYNSSTQQTAFWYMNDNVRIATANGPTLPDGWSLIAP